MKLVLCVECFDVFKLDYEMRTCKCKRVKGRYIDNVMAEVSENAISIGLGNGAVANAIYAMNALYQNSDGQADRRDYIDTAPIVAAWVRPNEGPGNPHTRVLEAES